MPSVETDPKRTTRTTASTGGVAGAATVPGFPATLASEWRKLWSLPSTYAFLAITVAMTTGLTTAVLLAGGAETMARAQQDQKLEAVLFGALAGAWIIAALGAAFATVEYRTGLIAFTLVATPRRRRLLAAKLVLIAALAVATGWAVSFANFAVSQGVLGAIGYPTLSLTDGGLLRTLLTFLPLAMLVQAMLAAGAAVVLRNAVGAVALVFAVNMVPIGIAEYLGTAYTELVPRLVPGAAAESLAGVSTPGSPGYLPFPAAVLTVAVWLAVALIPAFAVFTRRDAGA